MGKTQTLLNEAEDTHTINRMSVREAPVEVITRGERRRIWTPEQKRDIVMESLEPGGSPIAVARRHGIGSGLLYTWRRLEAPSPRPNKHVHRSCRKTGLFAALTLRQRAGQELLYRACRYRPPCLAALSDAARAGTIGAVRSGSA
jgi:hypothetical protein